MSGRPEDQHETGARRGARLAFAVACAILLAAIMIVTVIDVIGRYLLNSPLMGATELTELLLCAVIFLGMPAVCLDDAHIKVDILLKRVPPALEPLRSFVINLGSTGILCVIAWQLWKRGSELAGYGQSTNTLHIPVAPLAWFAAVAVGLSAAITLVNSFAVLRPKRSGAKP